jgi:hypothetical protein
VQGPAGALCARDRRELKRIPNPSEPAAKIPPQAAFGRPHYTIWPPSTTIVAPVTKEAVSEHSRQDSCGDLPRRSHPSDWRLRDNRLVYFASTAPEALHHRSIDGSGRAKASTRILAWAYSRATALVSPMTPCFAVTYASGPLKTLSPAPEEVFTIAARPV